MDAPNTHQVFDWLWSSGQLSISDIARLSLYKIDTVINLAPPTSSSALVGEAELITRLGINYIQIPVMWEAPDLLQLRRFCDLLDSLQGCPTWVHCALNMRVSAFLYLWRRIRRGEDHDTAAFPLNAVWQPDKRWQQFINQGLVANLQASV